MLNSYKFNLYYNYKKMQIPKKKTKTRKKKSKLNFLSKPNLNN